MNFNMNNQIRILCTTFILLAPLTACEMVDSVIGDTVKPPCPSVLILANTEKMTQFRQGNGKDLIDITAESEIEDFVAKCIYDVDTSTGVGKIDIEVQLSVSVTRGAANALGYTEIPYFVTITDKNKNILNKGTFSFPVAFDGNRYRVTLLDDPVVLSIPIEPPNIGNEFIVYLGFQLTNEQLEYNLIMRHTSG